MMHAKPEAYAKDIPSIMFISTCDVPANDVVATFENKKGDTQSQQVGDIIRALSKYTRRTVLNFDSIFL